ncbi:cold-shock protein [Bacteroidota bacterium]
MGRSRETYSKKEVRTKKEKKRKDKLAKKQAKRETEKKGGLDDMIAYVDENGNIVSTPPEKTKPESTKLSDIEISVPRKESGPEDRTRQGVVSNFNTSKGFGFIRDLQTNESLFFHINNTQEDVIEGNKVSFERGKGPKGPVANNIKLVK